MSAKAYLPSEEEKMAVVGRSMSRDYVKYLKTLRRLPDDVVLDMATREFHMDLGNACICGWAMRAALSLANGKAPDEFNHYTDPDEMAQSFGGSRAEWSRIFLGALGGTGCGCSVCDPDGAVFLDIELAFVHRVAEAAAR